MILRKATENDISRIAEMEKVCFPHAPWSYEMVKEDVINNDRAFYIVSDLSDEGKEVEGYIGVWQILDEGHITNVAVHPDFRRKHIAEAMIDTLIEVTKKEGITSWTLEVRASNTPAISLYTKMGFNEAGVRKGYYQDTNEDAIIMWRR